ncbi:MAG: hypothetical protein Q9165_005195 [Trypethelium subeluteriae]
MPIIYGEGQGAFRRLQEEIIRSLNDMSIFAWAYEQNNQSENITFPSNNTLLADSPRAFANRSNISRQEQELSDEPYELTNAGLRLTLPCASMTDFEILPRVRLEAAKKFVVADLGCLGNDPSMSLALVLRPAVPQTRKQSKTAMYEVYAEHGYMHISDEAKFIWYPRRLLELPIIELQKKTVHRTILIQRNQVTHPVAENDLGPALKHTFVLRMADGSVPDIVAALPENLWNYLTGTFTPRWTLDIHSSQMTTTAVVIMRFGGHDTVPLFISYTRQNLTLGNGVNFPRIWEEDLAVEFMYEKTLAETYEGAQLWHRSWHETCMVPEKYNFGLTCKLDGQSISIRAKNRQDAVQLITLSTSTSRL